ncbi:PREDICTED: probable E3 ubiquitin-protein ligase HERC2 [Prunus mume]|uniref:Probable E3 ubiquitin-protein ligase HERC2 n=1 Tax=Prunus mume TaxID=102107 RepID=A0ABM1LSY2_PRUMU|nr:PREDICTED: probable E3 ubiquitin-protein ligase HERC2 [Prunus mume]
MSEEATPLQTKNVSPLRKKPRFPSTVKTQVGSAPSSSVRVKCLAGADNKKVGGMRGVWGVLPKPPTDKLENHDLLREVACAQSSSAEHQRDADIPPRSSSHLHQSKDGDQSGRSAYDPNVESRAVKRGVDSVSLTPLEVRLVEAKNMRKSFARAKGSSSASTVDTKANKSSPAGDACFFRNWLLSLTLLAPSLRLVSLPRVPLSLRCNCLSPSTVAVHPSITPSLTSTRGSGEDGQLGIGNNEEKEWVCVVEALQSRTVRSVVAGSRNSLAICDDGKLFTWGWNQRGTLGHPPEPKTENIPSQVKALANVKIVQGAIGGWHCLAVDDQGRAYAWGGNEYGQCSEEPERKDDTGRPLRRDIVIPQCCAPKLVVRQVAAGGTHSVVLTHDGQVWTWGQPWPPGDMS